MKFDENATGFLIADIARLMRQGFANSLTNSPLTFAQARALIYVARFEGVRQIELAELLEVQPITLARLLDTLVEHNLVERRADPSDRRACLIYLLPDATEHIKCITDSANIVKQKAFNGLDFDQAQQILLQIRTNLLS